MEAYWFFFRPPVISHMYTVYVSSFLFSLSSAIQFWIIQSLVYSTFFSLQLLSLLFSPEIGRLHRFGELIHIVLSFSPSILQSAIFPRSSVCPSVSVMSSLFWSYVQPSLPAWCPTYVLCVPMGLHALLVWEPSASPSNFVALLVEVPGWAWFARKWLHHWWQWSV
jgi:hypothetical protein